MKQGAIVISCILLPAAAGAGGMDVKVNKDFVMVSPGGPGGGVIVSGPPGSVAGMPPLQVMAENKKSKATATGPVMPDGSFAVRLPAAPGDSLKLIFLSADGKKKDLKVKVPKAFPPMLPKAGPPAIPDAVTVPSGAPPLPAAPPPAAPQTDSQIIGAEKEMGAAGITE